MDDSREQSNKEKCALKEWIARGARGMQDTQKLQRLSQHEVVSCVKNSRLKTQTKRAKAVDHEMEMANIFTRLRQMWE